MVTCTCENANPIWMCTSISVTKEPSPAPPPAEAPISVAGEICESITVLPNTGDNCTQYFVLTMNYLGCAFMQVTTDSNGVTSSSTVQCACDARNTSIANTAWNCDGTFAPVSTPSLMPAGEPQPVSVMPVSVAPVPTAPGVDICPPQGQVPVNKEPCDGILKGLDSATCNYQQTVTTNGVTTQYQTACECKSSELFWTCSGGIPSPAPIPSMPSIPVINPTPGEPTPIITQIGCPSTDIINGTSCSDALSSAGGFQLSCYQNGEQCNCASQEGFPQVWGCRTIGN